MTDVVADLMREDGTARRVSGSTAPRPEHGPEHGTRARSLAFVLFKLARQAAAHALPGSVRARIGSALRGSPYTPRAGQVRFGDLRRVHPIGRRWGRDRGGLPIDRYYVERFLASHTRDIQGRVLEVGDNRYTMRFGGERVERSDVLHVDAAAPGATIIDDLAEGRTIPSDAFDCIVLTQVMNVLPDPRAAMRTAHRILKPGGVLLMTLPGISQISRWDAERWGDYWRFTTLSARQLAAADFPPASVLVEAHGNVLTAVSFLHGLAAQELQADELDHQDPDFPLLLTVRATKRPGA